MDPRKAFQCRRLPVFTAIFTINLLSFGICLHPNTMTPELQATCTDDSEGLPSCDFDEDFCGYQVKAQNLGDYDLIKRVNARAGIYNTQFPYDKTRTGHFVSMNVSDPRLFIDNIEWIQYPLNLPGKLALCVSFDYYIKSVGKPPFLSVFSRLYDPEKETIIGRLKSDTEGLWKTAKFHACVNGNGFINFEVLKRGPTALVLLDNIRITRSTVVCDTCFGQTATTGPNLDPAHPDVQSCDFNSGWCNALNDDVAPSPTVLGPPSTSTAGGGGTSSTMGQPPGIPTPGLDVTPGRGHPPGYTLAGDSTNIKSTTTPSTTTSPPLPSKHQGWRLATSLTYNPDVPPDQTCEVTRDAPKSSPSAAPGQFITTDGSLVDRKGPELKWEIVSPNVTELCLSFDFAVQCLSIIEVYNRVEDDYGYFEEHYLGTYGSRDHSEEWANVTWGFKVMHPGSADRRNYLVLKTDVEAGVGVIAIDNLKVSESWRYKYKTSSTTTTTTTPSTATPTNVPTTSTSTPSEYCCKSNSIALLSCTPKSQDSPSADMCLKVSPNSLSPFGDWRPSWKIYKMHDVTLGALVFGTVTEAPHHPIGQPVLCLTTDTPDSTVFLLSFDHLFATDVSLKLSVPVSDGSKGTDNSDDTHQTSSLNMDVELKQDVTGWQKVNLVLFNGRIATQADAKKVLLSGDEKKRVATSTQPGPQSNCLHFEVIAPVSHFDKPVTFLKIKNFIFSTKGERQYISDNFPDQSRSSSSSNNKRTAILAATVTVGVLVCAAFLGFIVYRFIRHRHRGHRLPSSDVLQFGDDEMDGGNARRTDSNVIYTGHGGGRRNSAAAAAGGGGGEGEGCSSSSRSSSPDGNNKSYTNPTYEQLAVMDTLNARQFQNTDVLQ